jgi:hypothetical protein
MQTVSRLFQRTKPTYQLKENLDWMSWEVLLNLSTAIGKITGTGKMLKQSPEKEFNILQTLSL